MLKIIKDVTIRHDGREIYCTAGQIVNVRASFDINEDVAKGVEIRNADKFRKFVKLVNTSENTKAEVLRPQPIHNKVEQEKRSEDDVQEEPKDEEEKPEEEEKPKGSEESVKGKGRKKK